MNKSKSIAFVISAIGFVMSTILASMALHAQPNNVDLQLLAPNIGEILTPSSDYRIIWSDPESEPKRYRLDYSLNGGRSWILIEEDIQTKEYIWHIPYLLSDSCQVKITAYEDSSHYIPFTSHGGRGVFGMEFDPSGSTFVISSNYDLFIRNSQTGKELFDINNSGYVSVAHFSSDGKLLGTIDSDSLLAVYNALTGESVAKISIPSERFSYLEFIKGSNGESLLAVSGRASAKVFNIISGEQIHEYSGYELLDAVTDSGLILLYDRSKNILNAVNTNNGLIFPIQYSNPSEIMSACFSSNGSLVATGSRSGSTQILDVATGELLHSGEAEDVIPYVEFNSNDSLLMAVSTHTNVVKIWSVKSGELLHEIVDITPNPLRPPPYLRGAHFGPQGSSIITFAGNDGYAYAHLWKAPNWSLDREYWHTSLFMKEALINPNGSGVLAAGDVGAYLWPFDISKEIAESSSDLFRIGYVVSVDQNPLSRDSNYEVFPSPASDYVIVKSRTAASADVQESFRVFSVNGQDVSSFVVVHKLNINSFLIKLSRLVPGSYIIVHENDRGSYSHAFPIVVE